MKDFINMMGKYTSKYEMPFEKACLPELLSEFCQALMGRSQLWIKQMPKLQKTLENVM